MDKQSDRTFIENVNNVFEKERMLTEGERFLSIDSDFASLNVSSKRPPFFTGDFSLLLRILKLLAYIMDVKL